ncbi:MAG: Gfo/Idh/MocA family oxidoreductase [Acutalibacteraceae bacterium]|nr:Gfo/Idh/MocA family oxidoreductase [Acutalibacteraceae bacterium]
MAKFRWAYIGSGSIAESTAKSILKGDHEIVSVYGRTPQKAEAFAKKYGAVAVKTAQEAIDFPGVDGVYIATPHTSHVEYSLMALRSKKPVLCEKPVGISSDDVERLINAAKENDTYFTEAMWSWFSDISLTVKHWVKSGRIGKVQKVKIVHAFPGLKMDEGSRVRDPNTAGGALLDIGIYPITYCYNIFGIPDKIECTGEIQKGIDIKEEVVLHYGDLRCENTMSLEHLKESFQIVGTQGRIILPLFHVAPVAIMVTKKGFKVFSGKTTYLNEFDRVAEEIRQGKKQSDYIPFESTLQCMKIMDECRRQMGLVYPFEK